MFTGAHDKLVATQMLVNNNAYAIKSSCISKTICWSLIILHISVILPVNNMKTSSALTVAINSIKY